MHVTVFSKPSCQQCKFTCRSLDHASIPYEVVDLTTNDAALEYVQDLGYSQAPIVVVVERPPPLVRIQSHRNRAAQAREPIIFPSWRSSAA